MQATAPGRDELRRLAELRVDSPVVLSVYLNLDPAEFATPPARATAARSVLDEASRSVRELEGLSHDDRTELRASLERCEQVLERDLPTEGIHGVALFACERAELFEAVRLPHPVENRVAVGRAPAIAPLARLEPSDRWCIVLVNRRKARLFDGTASGLREVTEVEDDVSGRHDQGGWSQARYQRAIEKEVEDHFQHTGDLVFRLLKRVPFDRLAVGGPDEVGAGFERGLHPYLTERLAGRIDVDVENANADGVLEAARPLFEQLSEQRETDALERLGNGRGAVGLIDVLDALNQQRVESLLLSERFAARGTVCPSCGWVGPEGVRHCPVDGSDVDEVKDVAEPAVELAVRQAAGVLPLTRHYDRLDGGIGALLRF